MGRNEDVVDVLSEIADLLEIQGIAFKSRAYQRAAQSIAQLVEPIERLVDENRLGNVPGIGDAIEKKIRDFLDAGHLPYLDELRAQVPAGLRDLMQLPNVGPKKALRLYKELHIQSLADLEAALAARRLQTLKGFGAKSEASLAKALERQAKLPGRRFDWLTVHEHSQAIESVLRGAGIQGRIVAAGSYRRARDLVGDLDLLVEATQAHAEKAMKAFTSYRDASDVLEAGTTRSRILLRNGLQVDLRVVLPGQFGAALLYFTGSKEHNIAIRSLALQKGYTLNEYALTSQKTGKALASRREEDIYARLGLSFIPPEIRENQGEIELAKKGTLPRVVEPPDLGGDLHVHTTASDGSGSARGMAEAASSRGYAYVGISDHSAGLKVANGLTAKRQARQRAELRALSKAMPKLEILQGSELEIRKDGSLDLLPEDRANLDYVIGAVHSSFQLSRKEQTRRVVRAIESGIDILAHPLARRIRGKPRPAIDIDLEAVAEAAHERGVLLEIDGTPDRLDLPGEAIRTGRALGATFVISSDAHAVPELAYIEHGVRQARRGALEPSQVANAGPLRRLSRFLGHARG